MATLYDQLLDATVDHLRELKARGRRNVTVSTGVLAALASPVLKAAPNRAIVQSAASRVSPRAALEAKQTEARSAIFARPVDQPKARAGVEAAPRRAEIVAGKSKEEAMADLKARAMVCQKCPRLAASRKNVVFGVGDINSALMFVGEAPGADEDAQGEPFVGAAGQLLTKIILAMGLSRETVYIANILKCRPDTPGEAFGNRPPTGEEMKTCLPYLLAQIDLIQPKVMVALGSTAVKGLLATEEKIGQLRGRFQTFRGIPVMPTYHPSYILRNQSLSEKRKVWEDMMKVLEKLEMPISEKQRGFFLKAG
jgi:DNA polymerase